MRQAGFSQEEMAAELGVSVNTIKYHFKTINKLLGVRPHFQTDFFKKFALYEETHRT